MYGWAAVTNCPGPGCPVGSWDEQAGYPVAGVDYDPALLGAATVFPQEDIGPVGRSNTAYTPFTSSQSAVSWLNQNAGKVALGVGGVFFLMLCAKAGR